MRSIVGLGFWLALLAFLPLYAQAPHFVLPPLAAPLPDPLPLRRVLVDQEKIPLLLEQARQGVLLELPRPEFERRVQQAARAVESVQTPPRLLETRYQATLDEAGLAGAAQWTVLHAARAAGILPLQPFNLALRKSQFNNQEALLGELDGKNLGLWVEQAGKRVLTFEWSARGEPGLDGLRFDLRVPACPLASLELTLPADRVLAVNREGCLLSGPLPARTPNHRVWRLECPGVTQMDLLVQQSTVDGQRPALILPRFLTSQRLTPNEVESDFDFTVEVLHGKVRELTWQCDPHLRPLSVSIRNTEIESWEFRPAERPDEPSTLLVRLPEDVQRAGLPLRIRCLSPVYPGQRWTSPGLSLKGAPKLSETLSLHVSKDVQLDDWNPEDFVLTHVIADAEGNQTLTLRSGIRNRPTENPNSTAVRPHAQLRVRQAEVRARQMAWWQIQPDESSLTASIVYQVVRGRLFRLGLRLPHDWTPERVDVAPAELAGNWVVAQGAEHDTLFVDLRRPLESSGRANLKVVLRPREQAPEAALPRPGDAREVSLPLPDISPESASLWDGGLAVTVDPLFQATIAASEPAGHPGTVDDDEAESDVRSEGASWTSGASLPGLRVPPPWGTQPPQYYYPVRGQPIRGVARLRARPPRLTARCSSEVVLAAHRAAVTTRLHIQPQAGHPKTIDVLLSAPVSENWGWRVLGGRNSVQGMQRLHSAEIAGCLLSLGTQNPLQAAGLAGLPALQGSWYRLTLAEPLTEPLTFEATWDLAAPKSTESALPPRLESSIPQATALDRWDIPLLTVLGAERSVGELKIVLAGVDLVALDAHGLRETLGNSSQGAPLVSRYYQYDRLPIGLTLSAGTTATESPSPLIDAGHLTTFVYPEGRLLQRFSFQVLHWKQRTLPLRLPPGATYLAAKLDGCWIPNVAAETVENAVAVSLPVANSTAAHRFEIFYETPVPAWNLWTHIDNPGPVLPLRATTYQRTWCLPAGVAPLDDSHLQHLDALDTSDRFEALAGVVQGSYTWSFSDLHEDSWKSRQQRQLAEADVYLRNPRQDTSLECLGDVLYYLAFEVFKGGDALIVDEQALRTAGIGPSTRLNHEEPARPKSGPRNEGGGLRPLNLLGLVSIPTPAGLLITSKAQGQTWRSGYFGSPPEPVRVAVSDAAAHGHDSSGRFYLALEWFRLSNASPFGGNEAPQGATTNLNRLKLDLNPRPETWSKWQPLPGNKSDSSLVLVREDMLDGLTCALAGIVLVLGWRLRKLPRTGRYRLLAFGLVAGGLALLWMPSALRGLAAWPVLLTAALACIWYLGAAFRLRRVPFLGRKSVAIPLLTLMLCLATAGKAVEPAPGMVWLLSNKSRQESVLVTPDLLEQLRRLSQRGAAGLQGALILGVRYIGTSHSGDVDFKAEFLVHNFADEETEVQLPLADVDLQEALLDGRLAYPQASPPPQEGFRLKVKGRGLHTIDLRFQVAGLASGTEQDLHFTIPDLLRSELDLTVPNGCRFLRAPLARGAQWVTSDAQGLHLHADLGRGGTLQARWRTDVPEVHAVVQIRELYLWDLRAAASRLLSVLQYSVNGGALTNLQIRVPDRMEVRRLETGPLPAGGSVPPLKHWFVEENGDQRRVHVEFQYPVTHGVQIFLETVPLSPPQADIALPVLTPEGATAASSLDNYLGYRVEGCDAEVVEHRRITGIEPFLFASRWQLAGTEDPGPPKRAYTFRSTPNAAPFLRLKLSAPAARYRANQDVSWRVGPGQAYLHASAKFKTSDDNLAVVNWEVPAEVHVTDVLGKDIRSWSRSGSLVQVWLSRAVTETALELVGWVPRHSQETEAAFAVPCLVLPEAKPLFTSVRLQSEKGWSLEPGDLHNLWALPSPRPSPDQCSYVASETHYAGAFQVRPVTSKASARLFTSVELSEHRFHFAATIDVRANSRDLRRLVVRLRNWAGPEVKLEAPRLAGQEERQEEAGTFTWLLDPLPGEGGRLSIKLSGSIPQPSEGSLPVPEVTVDDIRADRWVALLGGQLAAEDARGAVAGDLGQAARFWPALQKILQVPGSAVWHIENDDWKMRVRPRSPALEFEPVRVFLVEQGAAVRDGNRWLHWADYWLYHEANPPLSVRLPDGAAFSRAILDGHDLLPLQPSQGRLWFPLTDGAGARRLRLCWSYSADREPFEQPNLDRPTLEGVALAGLSEPGASYWTLVTPPGFQIGQHSPNLLLETGADSDLRRAEAQLRFSAFLAERAALQPGGAVEQQLRQAQECFYRNCRYAEVRTSADGRPDIPSRIQQLLTEDLQLAQAQHFEPIRAQAEKDASVFWSRVSNESQNHSDRASAEVEQGTPTHWQADGPIGAAQFRLVANAGPETQRALRWTGILLALLLLAWILPYFPRLVWWLLALWPEELLLLGVAGCWGFGPWSAAALLIVIGICARLTYAVLWIVGARQRPALAGVPGTSEPISSS